MKEVPKNAVYISIYHVILLLIALASIFIFLYFPSYTTHNLRNPIICVSFGVIGGTLNASRYVIISVKNGNYDNKRILWQLLTPIHAGVFAIIAIILMKSGLHMTLNDNIKMTNNSKYVEFISIVSFLAGFTTEIFIKRLISASESLFGEKKTINEKNNK